METRRKRVVRKRTSMVIAMVICIWMLSGHVAAFQGEVVIPIMYDATGPNSAGDILLQKLRLGISEYWNKERGGLGGYKIVVNGIDFAYDLSKCATIYKELIAKGHQAIILSAGGPAVFIKPLANKAKVVTVMAPTADACYLGKGETDSYVFSAAPPYYDLFRTFVRYIVEVDWQKQGKNRKPIIGGFNGDAPFGKDVDKGLRVTCEKLGLKYIPTWCKFGITEAASQVMILKEGNADYVIGMQLTNESMVIQKECVRMNYRPQLLLHSPHEPPAVKEGYAINSWAYIVAGGLDAPGGNFARSLWKTYAPEASYNTVQWVFGFCVPLYSAMDRVIKKKGIKGLIGEAIKEELESFRNEDLTDGVTAPWTYTRTDHRGPQATKFQKCLDTQGNMFTTPWIQIPKLTPEEMTVEYYKK